MWTKFVGFWKNLRMEWSELQQAEFRQEELSIALRAKEPARMLAGARAYEEAEKKEHAELVARRVVEILREEGWTTKKTLTMYPKEILHQRL